jgi:hypothetical protein
MMESRLEYLVIYERGDKSYGPYVPGGGSVWQVET